jgi:tetratricopeptide (TPR) repeat protein
MAPGVTVDPEGVTRIASEAPPLPGAAERPTVPGYEISRELGRGGMGVVYLARQVSLNRTVALKMVLAGAQAGAKRLARFRAEAEAVARLQHPNIVQVYEVGEQDGRPYFSLEFVDGGSLDLKITGKPQPTRPAAQLVATLARAVHHAHQHGIIHRDLKPGNILLQHSSTKDTKGHEAEQPAPEAPGVSSGASWMTCIPKITDFGLAKRLDEASHTQTGDVLGTPSYMAPEQAAGQIRAIGPATDVYALGTILYELLTGRPPFLGETPVNTVFQVLHEDPVPPTRLQSRLPLDLETVCLKCLEKEPPRRYASAQALAEDLERFLAGEPVQARPATAWERAVKWTKRRPAVAALIAVSVLAAASLVAGGFQYHFRVWAERDRAQRNLQKALQAVDQMLTEVAEEQLATEPRMEQKRRALLEKALGFYEGFLRENRDDPAVRKETGLAYQRMADILRQLGQSGAAQDAYGQAITLLTQLSADFPGVAEYRQKLADSHNWLGELLRTTQRPTEAQQAYDQAQGLQERLVAEHPDVPDYRRDLARSYYNQGILLKDTNRPEEAARALAEAVALSQDLVRRFPETADFRHHLALSYLNLGSALRMQKQGEKAEDSYQQAQRLLEDLAARHRDKPDYQHELAVVFNNRGNLLGGTARREEAIAAHRQALARFDRLTADFPSVPLYRKELANTYNSLGAVLARSRDLPAAEEAWRQARERFAKLVQDFPNVPDYEGGLGVALVNLGWLRLQRQEWQQARPELEAAIRNLEAALRHNPDNPSYRPHLHNQYRLLAETLVRLGKPSQAVAVLREAAHKGFRDVQQLKQSKVLESLHADDDYQKLLSELERATKATPK